MQPVKFRIEIGEEESRDLKKFIKELARGEIISDDRKYIKELYQEVLKEKEEEFRKRIEKLNVEFEVKQILQDEARRLVAWNQVKIFEMIDRNVRVEVERELLKREAYLGQKIEQEIQKQLSNLNLLKNMLGEKNEKEEKK